MCGVTELEELAMMWMRSAPQGCCSSLLRASKESSLADDQHCPLPTLPPHTVGPTPLDLTAITLSPSM